MALEPTRLIERAELIARGPVPWGTPVPTSRPGIYIIALPAPIQIPPFSQSAIEQWIRTAPRMRLSAIPHALPTFSSITAALGEFWLAEEKILYIGKATCLRTRLSQFYRHQLGIRRPHAGGHWLKTLKVVPECPIYYSECEQPRAAESQLLKLFTLLCGSKLHEPTTPFANRQPGIRKQRAIKFSTT